MATANPLTPQRWIQHTRTLGEVQAFLRERYRSQCELFPCMRDSITERQYYRVNLRFALTYYSPEIPDCSNSSNGPEEEGFCPKCAQDLNDGSDSMHDESCDA